MSSVSSTSGSEQVLCVVSSVSSTSGSERVLCLQFPVVDLSVCCVFSFLL